MARRRRPNWTALLWAATAINVVAGLAFSSVTSAAKVRVVGALLTDQDRLRTALQGIKGKPALRGGALLAMEEIYRRPDVRTAEWSQNLFRRGLLTISYDRPVATVKGQSKTVLTSRGQVVQTREDVSGLPELTVFEAAIQPYATLGFGVEMQKVADVCARATTLAISNLWISVQENGAVCLNSGETGRVALGSPEDLDAKFEKLQELLTSEPDLLSQRKEIVLLAPTKAMVRPLGSL